MFSEPPPLGTTVIFNDSPGTTSVWMMAGGFLGVMCSPLHLCLALTRVYFETDWGAVYRLIAPSALLVVAVAGAVLVAA